MLSMSLLDRYVVSLSGHRGEVRHEARGLAGEQVALR